MGIIQGNSRLSHHTITTAGMTFSVPSQEDFTIRGTSQSWTMALGSLTELQNQLLTARDLKYITNIEFKDLADQTVIVSKLLNGLIKSSRILTT